MFAQHAPFRFLLGMVCCGLLLGLSAPGFNVWPLAWVALVPAFILCQQLDAWSHRFLGGLCLGTGFAGLYYLWFFDLHPLTWLGFAELPSRLVTLAGWLLLCLETGLITGGLFAVYGLFKGRFKVEWLRALLFPLVWVWAFSLLNLTPLTLPWAQLEYTQAHLWPMRWLVAHLSGSGVAVLIVLHSSLWAEIFRYRSAPQSLSVSNFSRILWQTSMVFLVPALLSLSDSMWRPFTSHHRPWPIPVAVVQGNLPIEIIRSGRLNPDMIRQSYFQPLDNWLLPAGTLLVYPEEGVVPGWTTIDKPQGNPMLAALQTLATQRHLYITAGISSQDTENHHYNSLVLISPEPSGLDKFSRAQFYHKRRLVPFGEFTPYRLGPFIRQALGKFDIDYTTPYNAGLNSNLLHAGPVHVGGLICFELIDSAPWWDKAGSYAQKYRKAGADLLVNSSNLGWFHQNPLLEAQFLAIGQVRAAEAGLPLVISSNTGISAIISGQGKILRQTDPNRQNQPNSQVIFYNGE
jgi:apolipoprotein N-acyltransferase